jgi:hypothetical protein
MSTGVLGIPDPGIWMAYLLCLAATALCVVHAFVKGRKADAEPTPADAAWLKSEKQVEEEEE